MVAAWLAATKAGAVVVNTMPMLRAGELTAIIDKAEVSHALCDTRLMEDLVAAAKGSAFLKTVVGFDGTANHDAELDRVALRKSVRFQGPKVGRDDVALLGFTSGTTGEPKATMHFHRDLLIIADGYAREVLQVVPEDVFVGSPPLAFTFGLGGLAVFPLRFGAAAALLEQASPPNMISIIQEHRATVCFTAPTAYRVMLKAMEEGADLSSLRAAVSAGETLPAPVYDEWIARTGKPMLDGIGATEMLHIFLTNRFSDHRPACTGRPVAGYEAKIVGEDMKELPRGEVGRLAVRGPTGCRYLADDRQRRYVRDGWNLTGDSFWQDDEGRFHFAAVLDFRVCGITHHQDLELENHFPAAQRVIAVYRHRFFVHSGHQKTPGLTIVVFHQDGGADFTVGLGDVRDGFDNHQFFIPRAIDVVAVDVDLDDIALGFAFQRVHDPGRQDLVDAMNIAQRKLDLCEHLACFLVDDLVGQFDIFVGFDDGFHGDPDVSENGGGKDTHLALFIAQHQPTEPFAFPLCASDSIQHRDMLPSADDAQVIPFLVQASGQFAVSELFADFDFIEAEQQVVGELADEFAVLPLIGVFDQVVPHGVGELQNRLVGVVDDVDRGLGCGLNDRTAHGSFLNGLLKKTAYERCESLARPAAAIRRAARTAAYSSLPTRW